MFTHVCEEKRKRSISRRKKGFVSQPEFLSSLGDRLKQLSGKEELEDPAELLSVCNGHLAFNFDISLCCFELPDYAQIERNI